MIQAFLILLKLVFWNIWNKDFIDNVQITFAGAGIEERGSYQWIEFHMLVQNHTLNLLSSLPWTMISFTKDDSCTRKIKDL